MTSKVTSSSAALPARRRRDSSEDFGAAGSLGSIGGSAVGSSVASSGSTKPKGALSTPSKPATTATAPTPTVHNKAPSSLRKRSHDEAASAASSSNNNSNSKSGAKHSALSSSSHNNNPTNSPPMSRRPFRKRKGSVDFSLSLDSDHNDPLGSPHQQDSNRAIAAIVHVDALPSMDNLPDIDASASPTRMRSLSFASGLISTGGASIEKLDALEGEAHEAAAKIKIDHSARGHRKRTTSDPSRDSSSHGTFMSQSHRFLLEAFMGDGGDDDHGMGGGGADDGAESLVDSQAAEKAEADEFRRERLGSFDVRDRLESFDVRDRLGSFDVRDRIGSMDLRDRLGSFDVRDRIGSMDLRERGASIDVRERGESLELSSELYKDRGSSFVGRRERLESWGGMSDLSIPVHDSSQTDSLLGGGTSTAAALAATIYNNLANDLTKAANADETGSISSFLVSDEKVPSKISTTRERLNSVNSAATDPTYLQIPAEAEIPSDIQKYVKAAMASVGDQLAEMAVAATAPQKEVEDQSELSSTASPMIGAVSDGGSRVGSVSGRPRSSSLGQAMEIAVDYDAVNAALNAADAAAGAIDLAAFAQTASVSSSVSVSSKKTGKRKRHQLPTRTTKGGMGSSSQRKDSARRPQHIELPPIPKSKLDERDMEMIRERARAAAGYVPPSKQSPGSKPPIPPKKKAKIDNPTTPGLKPAAAYATPKSTVSSLKSMASTPYTPAMSTPGSLKTPASKGQSSQKWDSMFDCLLQFIEDRRKEESKDYPENDKSKWVWDGNVPTTYKTRDGKALGRWVNNQRSAKSKGVLKEDREKRLVDAGLKWSVLASNSWNEMLEELRIYVAEQTKAGRKWDGNVPTNYRIKTKSSTSSKDDEDKNLGRWVNRQRSLYQAGKLRKDRQLALEKVGLKWSMLATTSWESMFETLCEYVAAKTKDGAEWDGNVPANYRTLDTPPRALGRWINRQRSAYGKDKLKLEYIQKLNKIGLKWSVHERRPVTTTPEASSSAAAASAAISASSKNAAMNGEKKNGTKPLPPIPEVPSSQKVNGTTATASSAPASSAPAGPPVAATNDSSTTSAAAPPTSSVPTKVASSAKVPAADAAPQTVLPTANPGHQATPNAPKTAPESPQTTVKPSVAQLTTTATSAAPEQVPAATSAVPPQSIAPPKPASTPVPAPAIQPIPPAAAVEPIPSEEEVVSKPDTLANTSTTNSDPQTSTNAPATEAQPSTSSAATDFTTASVSASAQDATITASTSTPTITSEEVPPVASSAANATTSAVSSAPEAAMSSSTVAAGGTMDPSSTTSAEPATISTTTSESSPVVSSSAPNNVPNPPPLSTTATETPGLPPSGASSSKADPPKTETSPNTAPESSATAAASTDTGGPPGDSGTASAV